MLISENKKNIYKLYNSKSMSWIQKTCNIFLIGLVCVLECIYKRPIIVSKTNSNQLSVHGFYFFLPPPPCHFVWKNFEKKVMMATASQHIACNGQIINVTEWMNEDMLGSLITWVALMIA